MNVYFDLPWLALAALAAPVLTALAFLLWHRRRVARLARLGNAAGLARLAPDDVRRPPVARAARLSAVALLATLALAGPRWGASSGTVRTEGIDVVLALDASLSMLAQDDKPSRLERMKQEVRRFRAAAPGDRIALLAFAGRSYILSPLTNDDGAIGLFLDNLDPSVVGQAGTALEPTIRQGVELLHAARGAGGRALVVLSDGEAFDDRGASLQAAKAARDDDIAVVTVGFGSSEGTTIPIVEGGRESAKRDDDGNIVITKYDPSILRDVAQAAGGEFIGAEEGDKGARIHRALTRLDAAQREVQEGRARPLRVTWFLLPALLLLLFDAWRLDGGRFDRLRRVLHIGAAVLVMWLPRPLHAQGEDAALRLFEQGRPMAAAQLWRARIAKGDARPITLYNYGTAMLAADSLVPAIEALERAAMSPDGDTRRRALYNLGLAHLRRAQRPDAPDAQRSAGSAIQAYRTLLMQRPNDADARWNYELALQVRQQSGGGGGSNDKKQQQSQQQKKQSGEEGSAMSRQQAEQLLSAAARDERETQARRQKGTRQERRVGAKDW
jgi:Ca-activated chloride channel family protein